MFKKLGVIVLVITGLMMSGCDTGNLPNQHQLTERFDVVPHGTLGGGVPRSALEGGGEVGPKLLMSTRSRDESSWYFLFYMGFIRGVPISYSLEVFFNGMLEQQISISFSDVTSATITNGLSRAVGHSWSFNATQTVGASVSASAGLGSFGSASVEASVSTSLSAGYGGSISTTETTQTASTWKQGRTDTMSARIHIGSPVGYWRWALFSVTDVFVVVRLDAATRAVLEINPSFKARNFAWGVDFCPENEFTRSNRGGSLLTLDYIDFEALPRPTDWLGSPMVWVPGGMFELGRCLGGSGDVTPVSTVILTGFYMSRFPVTQEQFEEVMGFNPSLFTTANGRPPAAGETDAKRPVEQVSWYDAIVFANRLSMISGLTPAYEMQAATGTAWTTNPYLWGAAPTARNARWDSVRIVPGSTGYRLPTDAQWEFAAKGGANPRAGFTFAGSNDVNTVAWYIGNSGEGRVREIGRLVANCLGLYDMSGNVWEWIWDWHGPHTSSPKMDPAGPASGYIRIRRGGSWGLLSYAARSISRSGTPPNNRNGEVSIRLVRP